MDEMSLIASAGVSAAFAGRPSASKGTDETICRRSESVVSSLMGADRDDSFDDRLNELHCEKKPKKANTMQMSRPLK